MDHQELLQLLLQQNVGLSRIYTRLAGELAVVLKRYKVTDKKAIWLKNKIIKKEVEKVLAKYRKNVLNHIADNSLDSWGLSNKHNNKLVNDYLSGIAIDKGRKQLFYQRNEAAFDAFLKRGKKGYTLSDRVWNLSNQAQDQINRFVGEGLTEGRSAAELSRDIRRFLKEPDKRFRRIRDQKTGKLKLSDPAKNYNPGRGVYRSSYKNALRLTRNEVNIAYRTSDHVRRQQLPFVLGLVVNLSPAHPRYDICDELQGDYPKDFVYTGWHPNCLCYTTTKLLSRKEFKKYLKTGKIDGRKYRKTIPNRATKFLNENATTIKGYKSQPYFIADNFRGTKDGFELKANSEKIKK